jgi:hypothetical protein
MTSMASHGSQPDQIRTVAQRRIASCRRCVANVRHILKECHVQRIAVVFTCLTMIANVSLAEEFPPAPQGTFSIAVIPDTQHYRGGEDDKKTDGTEPVTNPVFESYAGWIAENLTTQRIAFVSHVGDIVDVNNREQWSVARTMMDKLHGRIPYGISVGNHDMVGSGDSSLFQEFFPASRYKDFAWYGGHFKSPAGRVAISGNNANSFQLFSAEGLDFVFLHLECNAPDDVLAWADEVLTQHSSRRALVTSHMGLGPRAKPKEPQDYFDATKGRMQWKKCHGKRGNTPQQMWDKCFRKHPNLFMICCGDQSRTQAMHQSSFVEHGNLVHEVLSDYGSNGLRVMRFVPQENRIEVRTWIPSKNEFCDGTKVVPDAAEHQFDLKYTMTNSKRR